MSRVVPVFAILLISASLWGAAASSARYLEQGLIRKELVESPQGKAIASLQVDVERSPGDNQKRIALAEAYVAEGYRLKNGQLIMRGLEQYKAVLDTTPEQPEALLGLARVSLQNGVLDRAVDFFRRFLEQRPNDVEARNDLVIALAQLNETDAALTELARIEQHDQGFFPAKLTRALILRIKGDLDGAEKVLRQAALVAPSDEVKGQIIETIAQMRTEAAPQRPQSPAGAVTAYFKEHQIIGPKIARMEWPSEDRLVVFLRDFPVEQMPAGMKELLISRAQEKLKAVDTPIGIELRDIETGKSLLSMSVGVAARNDETSNTAAVQGVRDRKPNEMNRSGKNSEALARLDSPTTSQH